LATGALADAETVTAVGAGNELTTGATELVLAAFAGFCKDNTNIAKKDYNVVTGIAILII